jgi:hypothetical protein
MLAFEAGKGKLPRQVAEFERCFQALPLCHVPLSYLEFASGRRCIQRRHPCESIIRAGQAKKYGDERTC